MLVLGTLLVWSRLDYVPTPLLGVLMCPGGAPGGAREGLACVHATEMYGVPLLCSSVRRLPFPLRARLGGACTRRRRRCSSLGVS